MRTPVLPPLKKTGALLYALDQHYRHQGLPRRVREAKLDRPLYWKPEGGRQSARRLSESDRPGREAAQSPLAAFRAIYSEGHVMEDEQGIGGQDAYDDVVDHVKRRVGDDSPPRMRVKCPDCGSNFQIEPPDGLVVTPSDHDEEAEGAADAAVTVACPECEREFGVAAPKGFKFRDSEGAPGDIACHDEARKASEALVQHFLRRFLGRPSANDGRSALDAFKESYGTARRDGRLPAMPPD